MIMDVKTSEFSGKSSYAEELLQVMLLENNSYQTGTSPSLGSFKTDLSTSNEFEKDDLFAFQSAKTKDPFQFDIETNFPRDIFTSNSTIETVSQTSIKPVPKKRTRVNYSDMFPKESSDNVVNVLTNLDKSKENAWPTWSKPERTNLVPKLSDPTKNNDIVDIDVWSNLNFHMPSSTKSPKEKTDNLLYSSQQDQTNFTPESSKVTDSNTETEIVSKINNLHIFDINNLDGCRKETNAKPLPRRRKGITNKPAAQTDLDFEKELRKNIETDLFSASKSEENDKNGVLSFKQSFVDIQSQFPKTEKTPSVAAKNISAQTCKDKPFCTNMKTDLSSSTKSTNNDKDCGLSFGQSFEDIRSKFENTSGFVNRTAQTNHDTPDLLLSFKSIKNEEDGSLSVNHSYEDIRSKSEDFEPKSPTVLDRKFSAESYVDQPFQINVKTNISLSSKSIDDEGDGIRSLNQSSEDVRSKFKGFVKTSPNLVNRKLSDQTICNKDEQVNVFDFYQIEEEFWTKVDDFQEFDSRVSNGSIPWAPQKIKPVIISKPKLMFANQNKTNDDIVSKDLNQFPIETNPWSKPTISEPKELQQLETEPFFPIKIITNQTLYPNNIANIDIISKKTEIKPGTNIEPVKRRPTNTSSIHSDHISTYHIPVKSIPMKPRHPRAPRILDKPTTSNIDLQNQSKNNKVKPPRPPLPKVLNVTEKFLPSPFPPLPIKMKLNENILSSPCPPLPPRTRNLNPPLRTQISTGLVKPSPPKPAPRTKRLEKNDPRKSSSDESSSDFTKPTLTEPRSELKNEFDDDAINIKSNIEKSKHKKIWKKIKFQIKTKSKGVSKTKFYRSKFD